jgi:pilus assembly protein CpaB
MRLIFGIVMILGVGLAGFAVYAARSYISQKQVEVDAANAAAAAAVPTVQVYMVKRVINYGERITLEDLELIPYPEPFIPEGVFKSEADLFPSEGEKFRTALRTIEAKEVLMATRVSEQGGDAGVSSRLGNNMRAFALNVDAQSGVSGALRAGDKVDVLWITDRVDSSGQTRERVTTLLETSLRIIATDQDAEGSGSRNIARTVVVEVTPTQVNRLSTAQATGQLVLALVGAGDTGTASAVDVDQKTLLGIEETAAPEPEVVDPTCAVRTRKAGETADESVERACD